MITLLAYNAEASVAYFKDDEQICYIDALTNSIYASCEADLKEESAHPPWQHCDLAFHSTDDIIEWLNLLD